MLKSWARQNCSITFAECNLPADGRVSLQARLSAQFPMRLARHIAEQGGTCLENIWISSALGFVYCLV